MVEYLFNEVLSRRGGKSSGKYYTGVSVLMDDPRHSLNRAELAPGYMAYQIQIGLFSTTFTTSNYDSTNTLSLNLNSSFGLALSVNSGAIELDGGSNRALATENFIRGRSASLGGCLFLCGAVNVSYDGNGTPTGFAREAGFGIGAKMSTGALVRRFSPSISVGTSD